MDLVGKRIRNIQVQERLGRGGMGEVYLGFDETLERKVALKAIRRRARMSMETRTRFLREARVLSQLEHPHICRIYDFLEYEGREILVLEYVEGETLGEAMTRGLTFREKLVTAIQIAEVLVAAHAMGVIHRDLKPENVMWTPDGQVKVLDFGLARPLASTPLAESAPSPPGVEMPFTGAAPGPVPFADRETLSETTEVGVRPLAPAASPKKIDADETGSEGSARSHVEVGDPTVVSVARDWDWDDEESISVSQMTSGTGVSDVTLVGSVVGTVSYMSPEQARGEALTTASDMYSLGIILHELFGGGSAYGEALTPIAKLQRVSEAATLPLDNVDSEVTELVRNLERQAPALRPRAVDVLDRLRAIRERPARRRRQALAAGLLLALLGSGVKYTVDLEREQSRTLAALAEAEKAKVEAQQVSDFLIEVFQVSDPSRARGQEITAREVLEEGATGLDSLGAQPEVQARLLRTIAEVHYNLGLRHEARGFQERAVAVLRSVHPRGHLDLAAALHELGDTVRFLDDYPRATELYRESLELRRRLLPPDHPTLADSLGALGHLSFDQGRLDEARDLLEESVEIYREAEEADPEAQARSLRVLANTVAELGDPVRAEDLHLESTGFCEQHLGPDHPRLAVALQDLGSFYIGQSRFDEGEAALRRTLSIQEKVLDPTDPNIAITTSHLATLARSTGDYGEAETLLRRAVDIFSARLGPSHFNVGAALLLLGEVYYETGRWAEAREVFGRSLHIAEQAGLEDNYNAILARRNLGAVDLVEGRWPSAERALRQSLERFEAIMGAAAPETVETCLLLREAVLAQGRSEEATRLLIDANSGAEALRETASESPEPKALLASVRLAEGAELASRGSEAARARLAEAVDLLDSLSDADRRIALVALRAEAGLRLGEDVSPLLDRLRRAGWANPKLWRLADQPTATHQVTAGG